jgi:tryptophanyl-tRNA synthetase
MIDTATRLRRLTGLKPTGHLHLGNLLGAIGPMVAEQHDSESVVMIADLHAMTLEHDPERARQLTIEQATVLLAAGVDPDRCTIFVQSHLPEHSQLHYLLECATGYGEAHRMIQFKEKSARREHVRLSLLTYPVLMAADILLHDTAQVPVGDDQNQHLELARDIAARFNARYGATFVVPTAVRPTAAARIMNLADPTGKMGKSSGAEAGTIGLLDPPDAVRRKIMRAVTDQVGEVLHDPVNQPGVTNLLEIYAGCTGHPVASARFGSYGQLKAAVVEAVNETLRPLRERHTALSADLPAVAAVLADGAARARPRAAATLRRASEAIGLTPTR